MIDYVIYVLSADHLPEMLTSLESVRRHHPAAQIQIIGDNLPTVPDTVNVHFPWDKELWPHWYQYQLHAIYSRLRTPHMEDKKILWLDTDTYLLANVDGEIGKVLDYHDIAAVHAPGRVTGQPYNVQIPNSFPEWNIGVVGLFNSYKLVKFWMHMLDYYDMNVAHLPDNDQVVLRAMAWERPELLEIATLPNECNLRFGFGGWVRDKVLVLHGRPRGGCTKENFERIGQFVNQPGGMRAWKPGEINI